MLTILINTISFIAVIGILVTFHEYGHFWVARRFGVKVLRFSIGFGKPVYTWQGKDGTEYVLAQIPLGGYVKMLDERNDDVAESELPYAFTQQPLYARMAIVIAGPLFNFLLAIILYFSIFTIGSEGLKPVIADIKPASIAAKAGLTAGDEIISIDGKNTQTWSIAGLELIAAVVEGREAVDIVVNNRHKQGETRHLVLQGLSADVKKKSVISQLGIEPRRPKWPAIIGEIKPKGAAAAAGLMVGDEVLASDGKAIKDWRDWVQRVQKKPGETMQLTIRRQGKQLVIALTPGIKRHNDVEYGYVGAVSLAPPEVPKDFLTVIQYPFFAAWGEAVKKTWQISHLTLRMLGKMVVGEASLKNISGPLTIAQYAGRSASIGLIQFLAFMAVVSISLGVLNLLPIPVLDGGHLLYYLAEFVKGSPVSEKAQFVGQQMGIVLLGLLMLVAFYNDVMRLL